MSLSGRFFALGYDRMLAGTEKAGLRARREALLGRASGRVLEIGAGTGANLAFYNGVDTLVMSEPEAPMARRLKRRAAADGRAVEMVSASAEALPFEDSSFDTAVSTLVLCTVPDQARALGELHRVLKPGGRLLFIEHVRAEDTKLARLQDRINRINRVVAHGCNCNRNTLEAISAAGFAVTEVERGELKKAPPFVRPLIVGVATRA
jgi:ubiquinone/menaquinone biosynthesis C-methylase UbiE